MPVVKIPVGQTFHEMRIDTDFAGFYIAVRVMVREHLKRKGWAQCVAADAMGVSASSLSRWLSGEVDWPPFQVDHLIKVIGLSLSVTIVAGSNLQ
jgi:hypothetical protein